MMRVRKIPLVILMVAVHLLPLSPASAEKNNAQISKRDFHIEAKVGNGYLELPVVDRIYYVYSKNGNLAFAVDGDGVSPLARAGYAIDWRGNVLWHGEGYAGGLQAKDYLRKYGWVELKSEVAPIFRDGISIKFLDRMQDTGYRIDPCFYEFLSYLKVSSPSLNNEGLFIRLLDRPQKQEMSFNCNSMDTIISTRRGAKTSPTMIYKLSADKALLVDNSVAIMLHPDLGFYSDHPQDYHYISLNDAITTEHRALLTVSKTGEAKYEGVSIFDHDVLGLSKAEEALVNYLDQLFGNKSAQ